MKVLLHICCAVCATSVVERLRRQGHAVMGYFYNPNIQPPEEYLTRQRQIETLTGQMDFPLLIGGYDADRWFAQAQGLDDQPEGGERCSICFRMRLEQTAQVAQERNFSAFTTTLSVSPHKDAEVINRIGREVGNGLFLEQDFKKQDGFKRSQELSRKYGLYHQHYCGCIYSLKKR